MAGTWHLLYNLVEHLQCKTETVNCDVLEKQVNVKKKKKKERIELYVNEDVEMMMYTDVRGFESHQHSPSWGVDIGLGLFSKWCKIAES